MAGDIFKFVDSVASSPTVRLDLNDGSTWVLEGPSVDFSPPPLRRAINGTLLTDGSVQSSSSYDNRLLRFTVSVGTGSTDATATQIQSLNRELDREWNYLMWQPAGATSPVFFRTLRTPVTQVQPLSPLNTSNVLHVEVLAEPFAVGLREDVSIGTVNNDPAAASNGLFFDVTGVKGDVATPIVIKDATALRAFGILACRQHGTPSDLVFAGQCESMTLGTDTTNPGGGPDAAMSGTGTNNFVRTSFATNAGLVNRVTWLPAVSAAQRLAQRGTFRVIAFVRHNGGSSVFQVSAATSTASTTPVTVPSTTGNRQLVDLGLLTLGGSVTAPGRYGVDAPIAAQAISAYASRSGGSGTLDWDCLVLVPADEQLLLWDTRFGSDQVNDGIVDAVTEAVYTDDATGGAIFGGSVGLSEGPNGPVACAGGFPMAKPAQTNRFYLIYGTSPTVGALIPAVWSAKTTTANITVSYWPLYLYARPAST